MDKLVPSYGTVDQVVSMINTGGFYTFITLQDMNGKIVAILNL
jgi:hypothetical protein